MDLSKSYMSQGLTLNQSTGNLSDIEGANQEAHQIIQPKITSKKLLKRKRNAEKWPELRKFMFNAEQKAVLGRNMPSWLRILLFYFGFYCGLAAFWTTCFGVFVLTLDEIYPRWHGYDSALKNTPGLSFRPMPDHQSSLIRFEQGKPQSYKHFTDHIQVFLEEYENEKQVGENFINCKQGRPPDSLDKVCRFHVDELGPDCTWQKDYGYDEGQPCILLKLNKVYNWYANTYKPNDTDNGMMRIDPSRIAETHVGITCEPLYAADYENIGNVTFWPPLGFQADFYPFLNQEGFRSPLVMAKFMNPGNGVLINVQCKAWARNILHNVNDQLGLTRFELLVD